MSAFSNEQAVSPKARATQAGTEHEPGGRGCTAEPAGGYASGGYGLAVDSSSAWPPCALAARGHTAARVRQCCVGGRSGWGSGAAAFSHEEPPLQSVC